MEEERLLMEVVEEAPGLKSSGAVSSCKRVRKKGQEEQFKIFLKKKKEREEKKRKEKSPLSRRD